MYPKFDRHKRGSRLRARDHNDARALVGAAAASGFPNSKYGSSGFHTRRMPVSTVFSGRIFEVQNVTALGWGVYNCYEQHFDKDDWTSTGAGNRFSTKNADIVQVFNLIENRPVAGYDRALGKYDLIKAWRDQDDEKNQRWMGIPIVNQVRRFRTTEVATANDHITCNMMLNNGIEAASAADIVYNVEVYCNIHGAGALNVALPDLVSGGYLEAVNEQGIWRCTNIFGAAYECP